jgi:hypothetical protein
MSAWNPNRYGEIPLGDRASPDFVTTLALANQKTAGAAQQIAQYFVELRGHLRSSRFDFAQCRNLQK